MYWACSHHVSSWATSCHLLDEILQWSFTDRSYILALAFYESCYIHPFWLYHHAIIGCFYFHVSKKLRSWRRASYGICPLLLSLFCRICPAVVMRTMVPVLPMTDQPQGGHSEPSQPFRPQTLIQICTPGGARWSHQSIRAAFQRCSQQRRREVMNGTQLLTWKLPPSCWATVARWTDHWW